VLPVPESTTTPVVPFSNKLFVAVSELSPYTSVIERLVCTLTVGASKLMLVVPFT